MSRVVRRITTSGHLHALCFCGALSALGCDPSGPPGDSQPPVDAGSPDSSLDAAPIVLVDLLAPVSADADQLARDDSHLYWIQDGAVYRVDKTLDPGANPDLVIAPADAAAGLAVSDGQVYWSSRDQRTISRGSVDGGAAELVVAWAAPDGPALTLLVDETHVYWREEFALARADKNGGERELLFTSGESIGTMTMSGDALYFTTPGAGYEVHEIPKSGGPSSVAFGIIALSSASVLGSAPGMVLQCGKDTVDPYRSLIAGYQGPSVPGEVLAIIPDVAMSVSGDNKYAYCAADTGIHRVPRSGGMVQMLAGGERIVSLVVDEQERLFWLDQGTLGLYRRLAQ